MTSTDTSTGGTAVGEQLLVTITDPGTAYTDDGQVLHADPDQLSAEVLGYAAQVAQTEKVAVPVVIINDAASAQAHVVVYPDGTVDDGSASVAVPQDDPANDAVAYEAPTTPATDAGPELSGEQVPAQPAQAYSDVPGGSSPVAAEQSWQPTPASVDALGYAAPTTAPPPPRPNAVTAPLKRGAGPHVPRLTGNASWWRRHRRALAVILAIVLVVVVGGAVALGMTVGRSSSTNTPPDPVAALASTDPASDAAECPASSGGALTQGRGPGDQTSGPNVILAFEYAYFHWRSGSAARALATPDARIGSAADLQSGIDALNPAARYCAAITDKGSGAYQLRLSLIYPNGDRDPHPSVQDITTTALDGRTFISSVKQHQ